MEITHRDRNGQYWRFGIDCTAEQGETIRRALAGVRNMGRPHALSLSALMEEHNAGEVFANVETAILRGLADAFPVRITPEPEGRPDPTPPQPQQEHNTPGQRFAAPPRSVPEAADDEPAPRYWWERD